MISSSSLEKFKPHGHWFGDILVGAAVSDRFLVGFFRAAMGGRGTGGTAAEEEEGAAAGFAAPLTRLVDLATLFAAFRCSRIRPNLCCEEFGNSLHASFAKLMVS